MSNFSMKVAVSTAILGGIVASAVSASAALNLPTKSCSYSFNTNMKLNSRGTDVMNLQKVLNMFPQTMVAEDGAGSPGMETTKFGPATRSAVNKFQALHLAELGITAPTGNVFAGTRALLNEVCTGSVSTNTGSTGSTLPAGCSSTAGFSSLTGASCATGVVTTNPGTTVSGPVSVTLASSQPMNMVVAGQAAAALGDFVFSGNGTVKSVKLMRVGMSDDQTLTNVYLYEGMNRVAGPASISRDGSVIFSSYSGLFTVAGSKTLTVRGDVKINISGQTIGFSVVSLDAGTGATSFNNVTGPQLTIGSVNLATVAVNSATVYPSAQTINAGSVAQNVWERSISVGVREVKLARAQFKMIGSAPYTSLANVNLTVDGTSVAQGSVDSNGYISFALPTAYKLTTGTHIFKVFADVVGGANRDFYVSLEQVSDLLTEDSQVTGAYVTLSGTGATSNMVGGIVTVQGGNFVITQDTSLSGVTTRVSGATNQTLGKWKFTSYGEDVKVLTLGFDPLITGNNNNITNVGLYIDGAQVRSNLPAVDGTPLNYTDLGTNVLIPAGKVVVVELRGDLVTSTSSNLVGTTRFNIRANSTGAQGMSSQKIAAVPSSNGQLFTIGGANVNFAIAAGSADRTVSPNTSNVKIGSFVLQTGSSEGVNVTSFTVALAGTLLTNTKLANLTVKDGSTVIGNIIGLPTSSNTFSANVNVPVSTTKTFDVYADIQSGAATGTTTPTVTVSYTGLESRQSTNSSPIAGVKTTANVATIAANGITFVPGSSPVAQLIIGGVSSLQIANFNVRNASTTGGAIIKDITFEVPTNTVSSVTVNGKTASVVGNLATIYGVDLTVPADASGINIPVSVALVCVNASAGCAGVSSSTVTLKLKELTYNDGETVQGPITSGSSTPVHALVASKPTVTMASVSTTGFGPGTVKIGEFTISADAAGDIALKQFPITVATSGATSITVSAIELRDSTGASVITDSSTITSSGANSFVLSTPRKITKGTSETYTVYGTFAGVSGAAGTQSVTFGLGSKALFLWDDVVGGASNITGSLLNTYPNTTQSKTN